MCSDRRSATNSACISSPSLSLQQQPPVVPVAAEKTVWLTFWKAENPLEGLGLEEAMFTFSVSTVVHRQEEPARRSLSLSMHLRRLEAPTCCIAGR